MVSFFSTEICNAVEVNEKVCSWVYRSIYVNFLGKVKYLVGKMFFPEEISHD